MAPKNIRNIDRMPLVNKILTYAFLFLVGATMIVPFLWMTSTALKPKSQVDKTTWLPYREFVKVNGQSVEVLGKRLAEPGVYRVKVLGGPAKGELRNINTRELTESLQNSNRFSYHPSGNGPPVNVLLKEIVTPRQMEVRYAGADGEEASRRMAETDINRRISPRWENFVECIDRGEVFGRSFINSLVMSIIVTLGQLATCSLAAFAFARLDFKGRDFLFLGYLATLMIPGAVTMIPLFVILKAMPEALNWVFHTSFFSSTLYFTLTEAYLGKVTGLDSFFALIVPGLFSAYGTFMLRQFFMGIPVDLEDAAFMDGCSLLGVYWRVALPLSMPAMATLGILTFMNSWRNFIWPLVVTATPEMQTVFVMLSSFAGVTGTEWHLLMAGNLLVLAPMIVVFLFGQRFFIEGIQLGGVKG